MNWVLRVWMALHWSIFSAVAYGQYSKYSSAVIYHSSFLSFALKYTYLVVCVMHCCFVILYFCFFISCFMHIIS